MKLMQRHQKIFGLTSAFESSVQNSKFVDMAYPIFIFLSENESLPIVTCCNIIKFLATQPRLSVSVPQSWFWYRKVGSMKSEFLYRRMLLGNESVTFTAHPVAFAGVSFSIRKYLGRTFSRNGSVSPYIFYLQSCKRFRKITNKRMKSQYSFLHIDVMAPGLVQKGPLLFENKLFQQSHVVLQ